MHRGKDYPENLHFRRGKGLGRLEDRILTKCGARVEVTAEETSSQHIRNHPNWRSGRVRRANFRK